MIEMKQLPITRGNVPLRYARGHFATNHSHINYYIDITYQKTRLSEAQDVARQLMTQLNPAALVETILCLDGTAVIGTCLANELTKSGFQSINAHQSIYVLEPEYNANPDDLPGQHQAYDPWQARSGADGQHDHGLHRQAQH